MTSAQDAAPQTAPVLVDAIAQRIQGRIIDGTYEIGEPLRQDALAAEFGVSRTPIREALRQVQAAGLIDVLPNRGAVVRAISPREVREAYVVRAELEALAAGLAAQYINDEELGRLRAAEDLFRSIVEAPVDGEQRNAWIEQWSKANDQFHGVVLEACHNRRLREAVLHFHLSFPRNLTGRTLAESSRRLAQNVAEHAEVLRRIADGDVEGAATAMRAHVLSAGALVAERLELSQ